MPLGKTDLSQHLAWGAETFGKVWVQESQETGRREGGEVGPENKRRTELTAPRSPKS